jgi:hypothetical protein
MRWALRSVVREPLVLFLAAGAGLFLLWSAKGDSGATTDSRIVVGEETIRNLAQNWTRTRLRPPTTEELHGLVEDHVREEVFYREALSLGLDRDDTIIRRRLRQKLEFVSDDLGAHAPPSEEQLRAFLAENPDPFRRDPRFTWTHVFLSPKRDAAGRTDTVRHLLAELNGPRGARDAGEAGDPFLLPFDFDGSSSAEVAALFGDAFASAMGRLGPGRWHGPIQSAYGEHLVLVRQIVPGHVPPLDEIRDAVRREWETKNRRDVNEAFYQKLRSRYRVLIEELPGSPMRTATGSGQ